MKNQGIHFPSINELMENKSIKSKYQLVVAVGIRAREVDVASFKYRRYKNKKQLGIALEEIYNADIDPNEYAEYIYNEEDDN